MMSETFHLQDEEAEARAREDTSRRGRAIYQNKLKAQLEPKYNNQFIAIHPDSEDYIVANSTGNAMRAMRKIHPVGRLLLMKIGPEPEYGLAARILASDMVARGKA